MRSVSQLALAMALATPFAACMHDEKKSHVAEVDPLASPEELAANDPDPDASDSPSFCNPTGKTGDELRQCYEKNETLYKEFDEEAKKREPWFNFTPDSWVSTPELDASLVQPVTHDKPAVQRLAKTSFIALQASEAEQLTGKKAPAVPDVKPYLVRALMYYRDNGTFTVFAKGDDILVQHDSRGSTTPNETRSAVVVYLKQKPRHVYVDCGVGE